MPQPAPVGVVIYLFCCTGVWRVHDVALREVPNAAPRQGNFAGFSAFTETKRGPRTPLWGRPSPRAAHLHTQRSQPPVATRRAARWRTSGACYQRCVLACSSPQAAGYLTQLCGAGAAALNVGTSSTGARVSCALVSFSQRGFQFVQYLWALTRRAAPRAQFPANERSSVSPVQSLAMGTRAPGAGAPAT